MSIAGAHEDVGVAPASDLKVMHRNPYQLPLLQNMSCLHGITDHVLCGFARLLLCFVWQDNAVLYCIGDLNVDETEEQIRQMFGHLGGVPDTTVRGEKVEWRQTKRHYNTVRLLPWFL